MDLSLSLFLFSYGDNKDQEEEEDYFDSGFKKKFSGGERKPNPLIFHTLRLKRP